jgi:bis(5'-nucleosyl)-tetraphosphatase (symmetrical)
MATYAIGDIQGCMETLERLLHRIGFSPDHDRLWLVGDLVNRGPRSLDVLRWARTLDERVTCVLGNHDVHLLGRAAGVDKAKKRDTLDDILAAPDRDELLDWLRTRPFLHVEGNLALVHAGLHPFWAIDDALACAATLQQGLSAPTWREFLHELNASSPPWDPQLRGSERARASLAYLVRARTLTPAGQLETKFDGPPADAPPGCVPWFAFSAARWTTHTVVFGHWAALGLSLGAHHMGIDTGCVWGNALTAIRLDDRRVFQEKSVENILRAD